MQKKGLESNGSPESPTLELTMNKSTMTTSIRISGGAADAYNSIYISNDLSQR
jgi:hypothetical protein